MTKNNHRNQWNRHPLHLIIAPFFGVLLLVAACVIRLHADWRHRYNAKLRVVWGPTSIPNIKYWSKAIRKYEYESTTLVYSVSSTNSRNDFDLTRDDFPPRSRHLRFLKPYIIFSWVLMKFDIFNFFFDGGFLNSTYLASFECQLLKIAGKKIAITPYGYDIAVPEYLGKFRESVLAHYPLLLDQGPYIKKRVLYFSKWAFVIKNFQEGFLPQYDFLWSTFLGIDTDLWKVNNYYSAADGHTDEVVVVHSSNHRKIKGTDEVIKAVNELQAEGLKVRLELFDKRPNEEVRASVFCCDIVVEQLLGGYALTAIEAMSSGKPVLSNVNWWKSDEHFKHSTCLKECPIVATSLSQIKEDLRKLIENPQLRQKLGAAGREYVLKYHSHEANGRVWDMIYRHIWYGDHLEPL